MPTRTLTLILKVIASNPNPNPNPNEVIAVIQLVNKLDGQRFARPDEVG